MSPEEAVRKMAMIWKLIEPYRRTGEDVPDTIARLIRDMERLRTIRSVLADPP